MIAAGVDRAALERDLAAIASQPRRHLDAGCVPAEAAAGLVERHGLGSTTELALLALPVARAMARAPISNYLVGVVGIEAETGDLVLGANLEFPGADLGATVHAEGFAVLRARRRGHVLATLALRVAAPCAHCRQTLAESATADSLLLVDLEGATRTLADLYPSTFGPVSLGMQGDDPARAPWPDLVLTDDAVASDIADALLEAGRHAHAPYSGAPSAAAVRTRDGRVFSAGCRESVAFNPSIGALQGALVELAAAGVDAGDIAGGWLGCTAGGSIDPEPGFRSLLRAVAPDAVPSVVRWQVGSMPARRGP